VIIKNIVIRGATKFKRPIPTHTAEIKYVKKYPRIGFPLESVTEKGLKIQIRLSFASESKTRGAPTKLAKAEVNVAA